MGEAEYKQESGEMRRVLESWEESGEEGEWEGAEVEEERGGRGGGVEEELEGWREEDS